MVSAALILASCNASTPYGEIKVSADRVITLKPAPVELTQYCNGPVRLAGKETLDEVLKKWTQDRKALVECKNRHGKLVQYTVTQQKLINER